MKAIFTLKNSEFLFRIFTALYMFRYGQVKLFNQQFKIGLEHYKTPISELAGHELLWAFFAYSYPFIFIVGLLQVVGGLLLIFNRTKLLGVMVLMPILLNILLMDIFYAMPWVLPGLVNDVFYLLVLIFVCFNERKRLKEIVQKLLIKSEYNFNYKSIIQQSIFITLGIVFVYVFLNEIVKRILLGIDYPSVLLEYFK